MRKLKPAYKELLIWTAIAGNCIFILWILYNGLDEGFKGSLVEKFSYAALIALLAINAFLLLDSGNDQKTRRTNHPPKT